MTRTLRIAATLAAASFLAACGPPPRHAHMWASGADASSSGTTGSDFGALQATGAPDVTGCGDIPQAWSPASATSTTDYLVLSYNRYVHVSDVRIYETYNPGAITQVDVEASDNHVPPFNLFLSASGDGNPGCPTVFHLHVDGDTGASYDRVAIYFNPSLIGDRNGDAMPNDFPEIDAVELDGTY